MSKEKWYEGGVEILEYAQLDNPRLTAWPLHIHAYQ